MQNIGTLHDIFGRGESCIRPIVCDLSEGDHKDRPYRTVPILCRLV